MTVVHPPRPPSRGAAFSLPEMMMLMALLAIILAIYAGLVTRYSAISRFMARKDTTLQAALVGLERMRSEAAQAVQVLEPAPGVTTPVSEVRFLRVDPTNPDRLPPDIEDPVPTTAWRPHRPEHLWTVRYFKSGPDIVREVTFPDGTTASQGVTRDVDGFSAENLTDGNLRFTLTVKEEMRLRKLSAELMLNAPPAVVP